MGEYDVAQLARLEPDYQQRLGLTTAPFPPTHEDRFLYLDNERLQRLNMLQHLSQYSSLLLIVTGERGIGKTSLMQRFITNADDEARICQVDANTMMDADQLLYDIARGFGLPAPPHDAATLQDELFQQLVKLREEHWNPVLLIDDAHELPQEALETIFNLADIESGNGNLLRIILFCEPQIETMLNQPAIHALRDRITHSMDIPPLNEEQTGEYIRYRLSVAGLMGATPFQQRDIHHIYKASEGVPAEINEAAHLHLMQAPTPNDMIRESAAPRIRPLHITIGSVVAILLATLIFQENINHLFQDVEKTPEFATPVIEIESTTPLTAQPQPPKQTQEEPTSPAQAETDTSTPVAQPLAQIDRTDRTDSQTPSPPEAKETKQDKPAATNVESMSKEPELVLSPSKPFQKKQEPVVPLVTSTPTVLQIIPAQVQGSRKPQTLTLNGEDFTKDTRIEVNWKNGKKLLAGHQVEYINPAEIKITLTTGTNEDNWQVVAITGSLRSEPFTFKVKAQQPVATQTSKKTIDESPKSLWDTRWIKQQPGQHLTLQLLASRQRSSIEQFVKQHDLDGLAVAFTTTRDAAPLYTVVLGSYPDRAQADKAITQLPTSLKNIKPWTRSFTSIHALLAQKPVAITKKPLPKSNRVSDQTAWLWSQDPRHYTLQLMSGKNETAIREFITQHKLKGKAVYFHSQRDGQSRYALVFGSYPSRDTALNAIKQLPDPLQQPRPWARSFSSIHAELPSP